MSGNSPSLERCARFSYIAFGILASYAVAINLLFTGAVSALGSDGLNAIHYYDSLLSGAVSAFGGDGLNSAAGFALFLLGVCVVLILCVKPSFPFKLLRSLLEFLTFTRIVLMALFLRVVWVLLSGAEQFSDFKLYDQMALEILEGKYILNPAHSTGPSIFFAFHYWLFGYNPVYPQISIAVLSTMQVVLIYNILKHIDNDEIVARFASFILAVWPEHIIYSNLLGSDVLFSTTILAAIWLISKNQRSPGKYRKGYLFGAGVFFGVSQWIRLTSLIFFLPALFFLIINPEKVWVLRLRDGVMLITGFIILVIPIAFLNFVTINVFYPLPALNGGIVLLDGTTIGPSTRSTHLENQKLVVREMKKREAREGEHASVFRDRIGREIAFERMRSHPIPFLLNAFYRKIPKLWGEVAGLGWSLDKSNFVKMKPYIYIFSAGWHTVAMAIFTKGLLNSLRARAMREDFKWDVRQIYVFAALLTTFAHIFLYANPRFRHMFLPFFSMHISAIMFSLKNKNGTLMICEKKHAKVVDC